MPNVSSLSETTNTTRYAYPEKELLACLGIVPKSIERVKIEYGNLGWNEDTGWTLGLLITLKSSEIN